MAKIRQTRTRLESSLQQRIKELQGQNERLQEEYEKFEQLQNLRKEYENYEWNVERGFAEHVQRMDELYHQLTALGDKVGHIFATNHVIDCMPASLREVGRETYELVSSPTTFGGRKVDYNKFMLVLLEKWNVYVYGGKEEEHVPNNEEGNSRNEKEKDAEDDFEEEDPEEEKEESGNEEPPMKKLRANGGESEFEEFEEYE